MPGVAVNGSTYETVVRNHISYNIDRWGPVDTDSEGEPINGWIPSGSSSTHARVTGTVIVPSSKMKISGTNVATVGDKTNETWVADPPVPTTIPEYRRYTVTPPGAPAQGSGQGEIITGSTKVKLDGKPIALIGSTVRTIISNATATIRTGNEKMKFSS